MFVAGPLPASALERLEEGPLEVVQAGAGTTGPLFHAVCAQIVALVPLLTTRIDAALLAHCPRLRLVANVAVGVDNIDRVACRERGVTVTNTPDVLTEATADLAFALLLSAARRVGEAERHLRQKGFPPWSPSFMMGKRVAGATLGIVGLGRIGRAVAQRAHGFRMNVLYTQRTRLSMADEEAADVTYRPFGGLLAQSDFVSLHVPLTTGTRHLIGARELSLMKPGSVLVNTARGAVVDEGALVHALADGPLFAAGLDVYEHEPQVHPGLLALENVVLSPHIGSAEPDTRKAMAMLAAENVLSFLRGEGPLTPVG